MYEEPGTIYSDDEVECFSEEDDEGETVKGPLLLAKQDSFFENLNDEFSYYQNGAFTSMQNMKKYLNKKVSHNIDKTIARVREDLKYESKDKMEQDIENELDGVEQNHTLNMSKDKLKVKEKDIKRKELKRSKKAEMDQCRLENEIEESKMVFEIAPTPPSDVTFLEMNLFPPILKAIAYMGYKDPTPIQASTIPIALKGRDICGCAATGTGKTAAFMLPILQRLLFKGSFEASTRVLVLVPTRELGVQVFEVSEQLARFCKVTISLAVGGLNQITQSEELLQNPDVIIATPGRLIDHIHNTPNFSLREIEILVLDEADRMLDEFFVEQLNEIVRQCCHTRQTMLFSATMTDRVNDLAAVSLKNPIRVFVNNNTDVAQNLRQEFIKLKSENSRLGILAYLLLHQFKDECMVFVPKKVECNKLHITFGLLGIKCGELHSNLKQHQRLEYLQKFRDKEINVLFATDVAARGLDIKGVKTVINYTVPRTYEMYVHRVGRTARAGFSGRSVTLAFQKGTDRVMLRQIQKNSLYPLYQRIIKTSICKLFLRKVVALNESVEKVIILEKEEKEMHGMMKQLQESKDALLSEGKPNSRPQKEKRKKLRKNLFTNTQDINREKERLKLIIAGKPDPLENKKKEPKPQKTTTQKKRKRNKKTKEVTASGVEVVTGGRKSNFEKELTLISDRAVKKLRNGPSFKERKEFAATKKK